MSNQVLNISRNGDSGQSLSQLCQCLTLLTIRKSVFLCLNGFCCVLICALASSPLPSLRRAWLHLIFPYQVFIQVGKIPPCHFFFPTLSSPSSFRLSLYDSCSSPLISFAGLQTFLKAQKNISRPWQLFLSLWWSSNFYCQCNCRGDCTCMWIDLGSAFFPPCWIPLLVLMIISSAFSLGLSYELCPSKTLDTPFSFLVMRVPDPCWLPVRVEKWEWHLIHYQGMFHQALGPAVHSVLGFLWNVLGESGAGSRCHTVIAACRAQL